MSDPMHPEIPASRREEAARLARFQAQGVPCKYCAHPHRHYAGCAIYDPSPEELTAEDMRAIMDDEQAVFQTLNAVVSPETRAFCEAELEAGRKAGWRLTRKQKAESKKEPEPEIEIGEDDRA